MDIAALADRLAALLMLVERRQSLVRAFTQGDSMNKLRILCASIFLLLGLAACSGTATTGDPTSVAPLASPAASGVANPASPDAGAGAGTGYVAPSQAPAAAPATTNESPYPGPSASP